MVIEMNGDKIVKSMALIIVGVIYGAWVGYWLFGLSWVYDKMFAAAFGFLIENGAFGYRKLRSYMQF